MMIKVVRGNPTPEELAAALAVVGIGAAVEAAGSGLAAVELPLLLIQGVELPLESVHIDLAVSGQHGPNFGAALCDFLTSLFKHDFFLLLIVGV